MLGEKTGYKLIVKGGKSLNGELRIHGAKNAVLPILAATLLSGDVCRIYDCPDITDVYAAFEILEYLGCKVSYIDGIATVDSRNLSRDAIPDDMMVKMRSSIMFLGPILARQRRASVSYPGGCELGARPIDLHLGAIKKLGADVLEEGGYINCSIDALNPCNITLVFPSVGATENIMLLSVFSEGTTVILNPAREPEIVDLQNFVNAMGGDISGAGTDVIQINGVKKLHGCEYRVIPDRISASTYALMVAACGGEVHLKNVIPEHMGVVYSLLEEIGCSTAKTGDGIWVKMCGRPKPLGMIKTLPYPGFPTDVQAQMMAALSFAEGTTVFSETMFDSRYKHAGELVRMGADITLDGRTAIVKGREGLFGAEVTACDLRGGAALTLAALGAVGTSVIYGADYIMRGYESFDKNLRTLGGNIYMDRC